MRNLKGKNLGQIAFEVCTAFDRAGFKAVLVGGGAAAFYAPQAQMTRDLDFVLAFEMYRTPKLAIIEELGFYPSSAAGTYAHDDIPFTLEILKGPLEVGKEQLADFATLRDGDLVLYVISAEDSVKDRLASGEFFKDLNAIKQAAAVASRQEVDLGPVREWCESEGAIKTYELFLTFLEGDPKTVE